MRDDSFPLAHVAIAVEGASVASPDIVPLMVANSIIGSFDLTYGGGKVGGMILAHRVNSFLLVQHFPLKLGPLEDIDFFSGHQ